MGNEQNDGAPIVQLLLTVSFVEPLPDLQIVDVADIARLFMDELPIFRQVNRASPMAAGRLEVATDSAHVMRLPRVSLTTLDLRDQMLFQPDRVSFGWQRTSPIGEPHDYPGFNETLSRLRDKLSILGAWASKRHLDITPHVGEAVYTDMFPIESGSSLSDIFTPLNPGVSMAVDHVEHSWQQDWPKDRTGHIFGTFAAPVLSVEGATTASLETTARFEIDNGWDGLESSFKEAHGIMTDIFEGLVKPEARAKLQS